MNDNYTELNKKYDNIVRSIDEEISERDELLKLREEVIDMITDLEYEEENVLSTINGLEEKRVLSEGEKTLLLNYIKNADAINIRMEEYRELLRDIEMSVKEYIAFDKKTFFQNVSYLLTIQNKKIGDLESRAGVRVGYMSRVKKPESSAEPSINFVATAAKFLGVSIDSLLYDNYESMTETEKYIVSFLEKLVKETKEDSLDWEVETPNELLRVVANHEGEINHPLYTPSYTIEDDGLPIPDYANVEFYSKSFGSNTRIAGDCYNIKIKGDTWLYIMYVTENGFVKELKDGDDPFDFRKEIWVYKKGEKQFLCDSAPMSIMKGVVEELYNTIEESFKHPRISRSFKVDMDAFMNDEEDEGLPFNF